MKKQPQLLPEEKPWPVKPERVEVAAEEGLMGTYLQTVVRNGGLYTGSQAAKMLGLSRARVSELVTKGRLPVVEVAFVMEGMGDVATEHLIPGNAIRRWKEQPKSKGGRGHRAASITLEEVAA